MSPELKGKMRLEILREMASRGGKARMAQLSRKQRSELSAKANRARSAKLRATRKLAA
jgi:hypothetical protein